MAQSTDSTGTPAGGSGGTAYRVLARKYRPSAFPDLIGQEAMVRTLTNAFTTGRIAQAYMLTGVRGVGKTTTARILARALNYAVPGQAGRPTTDMPQLGEHCQAIIESRHPDVLEMDAASNTGVDNVREIIESSRYKPILARTKVFIVDEVHMLSKGAFNALLKTLEEPPEHAKFIFATTEIRKVPVTVLSRCQRFDLRRVDVATLARHFRGIAAKEAMEVEEQALTLIARAAEGSVRDGLSVLDQAFATATGPVTADLVRQMLGVADRGRILHLMEALFGGEAAAALERFDGLMRDGVDPVQVLSDIAEAVHEITRARVGGKALVGEAVSAAEAEQLQGFADRLGIGRLSRAWSMLLKGIEEARGAPNAGLAAEMVLVRLAYMAELPAPDELVRKLGSGQGVGAAAAPAAAPSKPGSTSSPASSPPQAPAPGGRPPPWDSSGAAAAGPGPRLVASGRGGAQAVALRTDPDQQRPAAAAAPPVARPSAPPVPAPPAVPIPATFEDLVAFVSARRDMLLRTELEERVRLVRYEPLKLEFNLEPGADPALANRLAQKLQAWTGERWMVAVSREPGQPPLIASIRQRADDAFARAKAHPTIAALLTRLPGAELVAVRSLAVAALPVPAAEADDPALPSAQPSEPPDYGDEPLPDLDDYGTMDLDD